MVLVRRISMQDALKLAIFLTLVTFSSNMQDNGNNLHNNCVQNVPF